MDLIMQHTLSRLALIAATAALSAAPALSFAQFDDEMLGSLTVQCSYSDNPAGEVETVSMAATLENTTDAAATKTLSKTFAKTFQRGERSQVVTNLLKVGEVAECVFPSGNKVRTKVGVASGSGFGFCGGDPEVFASVWVNERKIASRVWFTGHCRQQDDYPDVSLNYSNNGQASLEKCHALRHTAANAASASKSSSTEPLSVCVDFPNISSVARDEIEYPRPGQKVAAVGAIEVLTGSHKVCTAALEELNADFDTFGQYPNQTTAALKLARPNWGNSQIRDSAQIGGSSQGLSDGDLDSNQSIFDFDNDGKLDRIGKLIHETHYMDGTGLSVELGSSSKTFKAPLAATDSSAWLLPCQMSATHYTIDECPPGAAVEAGFWMGTKSKPETIYFRSRYSSLSPFAFKGETFVGVSGQGEAENFVAIVKPMRNRTFQRMCLFRRVQENF